MAKNTLSLPPYHYVSTALQEYLTALQSIDEHTLHEHGLYLSDSANKLKRTHAKLKIKRDILEKDDPSKPVITTQLTHLNQAIHILSRAGDDIFDSGELFAANLRTDFAPTIAGLQTLQSKITTPEAMAAHLAQYRTGTPEEKYALLDHWYESGIERFINQKDASDRRHGLTLLPRPLLYAKWKFMLALADAVFDLGLAQQTPGEAENDLNIMARLFARLSQYERGADNPHMPQTHKLRHNPAIHSMHVCTLQDHVFTRAEHIIREKYGNSLFPILQEKMQTPRRQVMRAALLHDCGEFDGELSQGITMAGMNAEQASAFGEAREAAEGEAFERALGNRRDAAHEVTNGQLTDTPITDKSWGVLRDKYRKSFQLAERTDEFLGRLLKSCERIQSNHDYLRWNGVNGALPLRNADRDNARFSVNYVSKVLRDADHDAPEGETSLRKLAEKETDEHKYMIFMALADATHEVYNDLLPRSKAAYGFETPSFVTRTRESRISVSRS